MRVRGIHHVAYRCMDSRATAGFYGRVLGMALIGAIAEDQVPSTKERTTYMNTFLDAGGGAILAFFEVPEHPPMQPDPNTPSWLQHIAFEVATDEELLEAKRCAEAEGVEVIGPVDHTVFRSIYFFDPNGHRLEVAAWTSERHRMERLRATAEASLAEWTANRRPLRLTSWVHAQEFGPET